jgi:hypothetical protein
MRWHAAMVGKMREKVTGYSPSKEAALWNLQVTEKRIHCHSVTQSLSRVADKRNLQHVSMLTMMMPLLSADPRLFLIDHCVFENHCHLVLIAGTVHAPSRQASTEAQHVDEPARFGAHERSSIIDSREESPGKCSR